MAELGKLEKHPCRETCEGCPFGGPKVGAKGNPKAPLVIVGESPGRQEVEGGMPFVGPSGQILHWNIPESDDIYCLNAMECSPKKDTKEQATVIKACHACHERLISQINAHPRKLIVALGNAAVWSLTGNYGTKITQIRGRLIPSDLSEFGILPAVHPAALMKGTGSYRQFKMDMAYARELIATGKPRVYERAKHIAVTDEKGFRKAMKILSQSDEITADIETSGFSHKYDRILTIGLTGDGERVFSFNAAMLPKLKTILEHPKFRYCWHNGKFDVKFLRAAGINATVHDDTMLMSYAMDETRGVHDLETVGWDWIGAPDYKHMVKPWLPNKKTSYANIPEPVLRDYMSIDTGNTGRLRKVMRKKLAEDPDTERLYEQTLIPASEFLSRVEDNGIYVDKDLLSDNENYFAGVCERYVERICRVVGKNVNPNSPDQMSEVLYKDFKLPNRFKGSTDKHALEKLPQIPIVRLLREYRKVQKAYSTYVKGLWDHIAPDGRVYATFLIHGTITGRLASRNPNLQNIPRDPLLRGMFCATPGYDLLEVDLSQAELRSLAALSGDPALCEVYLSGKDLHTELALFLFGPNFTKEQRVKCKNVNFGIIYGITSAGLAEQMKSSPAEAQRYLDGWARRFPVAWAFIQQCRNTVLTRTVMKTAFGRKKRIHLVTHDNLKFLQNESANFPHQSIASDITLHAGIRVEPQLRRMGVRIVNIIHDALLMEVPHSPGDVVKHEAARIVSTELEKVPIDFGITRVPFKAEAEHGYRWGSLLNMEKYPDWAEQYLEAT